MYVEKNIEELWDEKEEEWRGYSLRYLYWNYVSYNEGLHTHIA